MASTLRLEIVTPEAITFSEDVEMVTLPGVDGEMGIFPQHVPVMTQVVPGEISVRKTGKEVFLAVGEGFADISGDRVSILTDMAVLADNIDEAAAEQARKRAEVRLAEKVTAEEEAAVRASLANSVAQLNVVRQRRRR
jgi:F-type H+-transporting ATPase subunit epsilon